MKSIRKDMKMVLGDKWQRYVLNCGVGFFIMAVEQESVFAALRRDRELILLRPPMTDLEGQGKENERGK
jgi:hypothetical protein